MASADFTNLEPSDRLSQVYARINERTNALRSAESSTTFPATTVPGQRAFRTDVGWVFERNQADTAWIPMWEVDNGPWAPMLFELDALTDPTWIASTVVATTPGGGAEVEGLDMFINCTLTTVASGIVIELPDVAAWAYRKVWVTLFAGFGDEVSVQNESDNSVICELNSIGDSVLLQCDATGAWVPVVSNLHTSRTTTASINLTTEAPRQWWNTNYWCKTGGGSITITLPSLQHIGAQFSFPLVIKKVDASVNTVTIVPDAGTSSPTIDGAANKILTDQNDTVTIIPDEINNLWRIVGGIGSAGVSSVASSIVTIDTLGTPTYDNLADLHNISNSAGLISGGAITNNGDGTVDVAAGQGFIRAGTTLVETIYSTDWIAASSLALTDLVLNYIYIEYNAGTPQVAAETTLQGDQDHILLGVVYRSGNEIHITSEVKQDIGDAQKKILTRLNSTEPFQHASGAALSETGTRNIATTAGDFWWDLNEFTTIAQDTSGASPDNNHTFEYFYYNGSAWITHEESVETEVFTGAGLDDCTSSGTFVGSHTIRIHVEITGNGTPDTYKWSYKGNDGVTVIETTGVPIVGGAVNLVDGASITFAATTGHTIGDAWDFDCTLSSQIDNTQYNDIATGLATLTNNRYGVHWVYTDTHGHLAVLFGQGNYTLSDAQEATAPATVPDEFEFHVRLIGKVIIQKSDAAFSQVQNNYADSFAGSVATDHGGLVGLADDDHAQYLLADGTRSVSGDLTVTGDISGHPILGITAKTTTYTITDADDIITVDGTSGAFTVTLPTAVGIEGRSYYIKKIVSGGSTVTVDGDGTETIDGATTRSLGAGQVLLHVVSDNANWMRLNV